MDEMYEKLRGGATGFYGQTRGLIAVWGREAAQFLNGLITNDAAALEENASMPAAFPNAQGRLLALVNVLKKDDRFLFETEEILREKVFQNLFRFTFAGDFFVEDMSEQFSFFRITDRELQITDFDLLRFRSRFGQDVFVSNDDAENFKSELQKKGALEISDELYEVLRIEKGVPLYGVDMDETTIVPELDLPDTINYKKGCYIGQEIIARIYFRGHVAKKLTGLILPEPPASSAELKSLDGKSAGRITSATFSPKLQKTIALAYVRYDYLAEGTELKVGDLTAKVTNLPFVE